MTLNQSKNLNQTSDVAARVRACQQRVRESLEAALLLEAEAFPRLFDAMTYSLKAGGKRIRPLLAYASAEALEVPFEEIDEFACALELIHTYSLIHDDLPAMDDDDLRRGRESCHVAFDEATAILAGDALLTLAFRVLAESNTLADIPGARSTLISQLAKACGALGMAGGQALDLDSLGKQISQAELEKIHAFKTGALIQISTMAPALLTSAPSSQINALSSYGQLIGLAFQVFDDLLDVTGSSDVTGKPSRADAARLKPAFPAIIGVEKSLERAHELRDSALMELAHLPGDTDTLEWLAGYAVDRDR